MLSPRPASCQAGATRACLAAVRRWIDATAGEEAVLAEMLQRWAAPQHEGGCGNSGRLT